MIRGSGGLGCGGVPSEVHRPPCSTPVPAEAPRATMARPRPSGPAAKISADEQERELRGLGRRSAKGAYRPRGEESAVNECYFARPSPTVFSNRGPMARAIR